ncbi:MAG: RSP_7527 family protein [Terasakiella sp.]|uniref:RSP_7527 family protein n=1 Tax=unclassified Terasakiella TaxID=2614952 RepID=UPI003B007CCF
MEKYMLLEAEPLTQKDIDLAIQRARVMRSEAAWNVFATISAWVSKRLHSNDAAGGSGLAHSS